jgi:ABC-type antimicrobial peptide transport system permease subunit
MYGVLTFTVANRRREMSLRIALGARPGSVLTMVVREGVLLAGAGFGIGAVATVLAGRSVSAFLYGVTVFDAPTMGAVLVVVLTVSACACFLPGWRASRENPSDALRVE